MGSCISTAPSEPLFYELLKITIKGQIDIMSIGIGNKLFKELCDNVKAKLPELSNYEQSKQYGLVTTLLGCLYMLMGGKNGRELTQSFHASLLSIDVKRSLKLMDDIRPTKERAELMMKRHSCNAMHEFSIIDAELMSRVYEYFHQVMNSPVKGEGIPTFKSTVESLVLACNNKTLPEAQIGFIAVSCTAIAMLKGII